MRRLVEPTAQADRHVSQRLGVTPQSDITNAINDTARDAGDGGHALYDPTGRLMDPNATEVAFAGSTVAVSRNGKRSTVTVTAVKPTGDTITGDTEIDTTSLTAFTVATTSGASKVLVVDTSNKEVQYQNGTKALFFSDDTRSLAGNVTVNIDGATGFIQLLKASQITSGTGSPETVVTAGIGSIFLRSNGTGAAALYVKTSGTGNTGWDAVDTIAGTQTLTNKTFTTPTIADLTNATHTHANAAGGGVLTGYQQKDTGYFNPPGPVAVDATSVTALTTQQCGARYLGMVPADVTSVEVNVRVTTAVATAITYAEVALASANSATGGNLTLLGSAQDVSAVFNSTGNKTRTFSVSVPAGTFLYLLYGSQATTPFQLRATIADELSTGVVRLASTTRPSTMAAPTAFSTSSAITAAAWCIARWS